MCKYPKIAGTASPTGSGDLKHPSFPPVAKGLPSRDLVDMLQSSHSTTVPLISSSAARRQFVSLHEQQSFHLAKICS
jgi:hypothetical protein